MLFSALHLALLFVELFILMGVSFYLMFLCYSWLKGAPYVGTQTKEIDEILKRAALKRNQVFIELGSGDGRVVKRAVEKYRVRGVGVDINHLLVWFSRIDCYFKKMKNIAFLRQDVRDIDISKADIIYIFLFPALVKQLKDKLLKTTKKNVLIISHGFKIDFLSTNIIDSQKGNSFTTYYYRLRK